MDIRKASIGQRDGAGVGAAVGHAVETLGLVAAHDVVHGVRNGAVRPVDAHAGAHRVARGLDAEGRARECGFEFSAKDAGQFGGVEVDGGLREAHEVG